VIRGKWILENFLGTPPPPPPADVPSLRENTVSASLPIRERLAEHRNNTACAGCHKLIDPVGFGLEEFDAVGRWRTVEEGKAIDATGGLPDGSQFVGVAGLEKALLQRPELFVRTLTEKLFTFALGRAPEDFDAPAIRKIIRDARANEYRFSSLIVGITASQPFQLRRAE
jgi:alkylation response protein AidB-like acyl-CoA dehydrogenase